jgi:hypothetical protein
MIAGLAGSLRVLPAGSGCRGRDVTAVVVAWFCRDANHGGYCATVETIDSLPLSHPADWPRGASGRKEQP